MSADDSLRRRAAWGFATWAAFLLVGWAGACGRTSQKAGKLADGSSGGAGGWEIDASASTGGAIGTGGVTSFAGTTGAIGGSISASGGTTGTGGAASTGGFVGPDDASAWVNLTVTFQVKPPPGNTTGWCLGRPGDCSSGWFSISSSFGVLTLTNTCRTPCDTCEFMACPIVCILGLGLTTDGATYTWDGTYFLSGTCGAQSRACLTPQYAPAGHYTAQICGFPNPAPDASYGCGQATSSTNTTCVDVPFDYPSNAPIVVTVPVP